MHLFQCSYPSPGDLSHAGNATCIVTPAGNIRTVLTVQHNVVSSALPCETLTLESGARLVRWSAGGTDTELLVAPLQPQLRPEMHVDGCVAALWRVQALSPVARIEIECNWDPPRPPSEFEGAETGEFLESAAWNIGALVVRIGTEDNDSLIRRAERN